MSSSFKSSPEIEMSFLCDVKNHRVVFLEANAKFVDILFGFLGVSITSLGKLGIGAMPKICESLASIGTSHLQPEFKSSEFLELKPTDEQWCNKVYDLLNGKSFSYSCVPLYLCQECYFQAKFVPTYITTDPLALCKQCGKPMNLSLHRDLDGDIIVRDDIIFHIFDDMTIKPQGDHLDVLNDVKKMGFKWGDLKEMKLTFTAEMICTMLKTLPSVGEKKSVLTDLFIEKLMKK
ncbi:uncharacterized protein LOC126802887 [Argentina anserina]|uniref:uncharacterized protein LOC126802887 n=1 Tax=Argentina anserina TaxID=57926 RepID=UPI0021765B38|nr:uncharacterized protein LOC126802887 [Potentilla anserina]